MPLLARLFLVDQKEQQVVNRDFLGPQEKSLVKQACCPEGGKALSRKHLGQEAGALHPRLMFSARVHGAGVEGSVVRPDLN